MRTSRPSIAELRAATQPASIFERNSGEHWAGRLYVRRFSPYLTRMLLSTPSSPDSTAAAPAPARIISHVTPFGVSGVGMSRRVR